MEVGDVRSWGCVEVVGVNLSCKRAAGRRTDILILGGCFAKINIVLYIEYVHSQSNFAIRGERERNNAGEHNVHLYNIAPPKLRDHYASHPIVVSISFLL